MQCPGCHISTLRLTAQIKNAMFRAQAAGRPVEMHMQASEVVLYIDGQQHRFINNAEVNHDLMYLPSSHNLGRGEGLASTGCSVVGPIRSRIHPPPIVNDGLLSRLRASHEEKADNRNKRKAVMLDGHVGPQTNKAPIASTRTIQRPASLPPNPTHPSATKPPASRLSAQSQPPSTARAPSPRPAASSAANSNTPAARSMAAASATGRSSSPMPPHAAAAARASSPYPARVSSPHLGSHAPSQPPRALKPPPPNSLKSRSGIGDHKQQAQQQAQQTQQHHHPHHHQTQQPGSRQGTPGPVQKEEPAGGAAGKGAATSTVAASTPPASQLEIPEAALLAAQARKLQLVVVALLQGGTRISNLGLFKLIDKVYRDAKAVPDTKEYIKRVVDNSTDRVPPNRLIIKQDVVERGLPHLRALERKQHTVSAPGSKAAKKKREASLVDLSMEADGDGEVPQLVKKQKKQVASSGKGGPGKQGAADGSGPQGSKAQQGGAGKKKQPQPQPQPPQQQQEEEAAEGQQEKKAGKAAKAAKAVAHMNRPSFSNVKDWEEDERDLYGYGLGSQAYTYESAHARAQQMAAAPPHHATGQGFVSDAPSPPHQAPSSAPSPPLHPAHHHHPHQQQHPPYIPRPPVRQYGMGKQMHSYHHSPSPPSYHSPAPPSPPAPASQPPRQAPPPPRPPMHRYGKGKQLIAFPVADQANGREQGVGQECGSGGVSGSEAQVEDDAGIERSGSDAEFGQEEEEVAGASGEEGAELEMDGGWGGEEGRGLGKADLHEQQQEQSGEEEEEEAQEQEEEEEEEVEEEEEEQEEEEEGMGWGAPASAPRSSLPPFPPMPPQPPPAPRPPQPPLPPPPRPSLPPTSRASPSPPQPSYALPHRFSAPPPPSRHDSPVPLPPKPVYVMPHLPAAPPPPPINRFTAQQQQQQQQQQAQGVPGVHAKKHHWYGQHADDTEEPGPLQIHASVDPQVHSALTSTAPHRQPWESPEMPQHHDMYGGPTEAHASGSDEGVEDGGHGDEAEAGAAEASREWGHHICEDGVCVGGSQEGVEGGVRAVVGGRGRGKGLLLAGAGTAYLQATSPALNTQPGWLPEKGEGHREQSREGPPQGQVLEAGICIPPAVGAVGDAAGAQHAAPSPPAPHQQLPVQSDAQHAALSPPPFNPQLQLPPAEEDAQAERQGVDTSAKPTADAMDSSAEQHERSQQQLAQDLQRQEHLDQKQREQQQQQQQQQEQQPKQEQEVGNHAYLPERSAGHTEQPHMNGNGHLACSPSSNSAGECGSEGNVDDELWNEVEPENDPPHEAALYAEFLDWCPPNQRAPIQSHAEHAAVEAEYRRKHDIYFLVHQKYNAVMTELQSLRNEADKAARCGLAAEFSKWRRMLWAQGARKYCQLRTWQRVSGALHKDLLALREIARAYVLSQRS